MNRDLLEQFRYLPLSHQLLFEFPVESLAERLVEAVFGQSFAGKSALTFVWAAIPYRMEWRYGLAAHKVIAIDTGHVCQNLYLACEAIGAGACAVAAYGQEAVDRLIGVDGNAVIEYSRSLNWSTSSPISLRESIIWMALPVGTNSGKGGKEHEVS